MHVNTALAQVSNVLMLTALASYSLAVIGFAGDFAYGRPAGNGALALAGAKVPALAAARAPRGGMPGDRPGGAAGSDAPAARSASSAPPRTWPRSWPAGWPRTGFRGATCMSSSPRSAAWLSYSSWP